MAPPKKIKRHLEALYRKHNPSKLKDLDGLLAKYAGRERELLDAVKKKYKGDDTTWPSKDYEWSFVLKRFPNKKESIWVVDESLKNVEMVLKERAASIGGECKMRLWKDGQRALLVVRNMDEPLCDKGKVTSTVEAMQMDLIHRRHSYTGRPSDVQDEHERRKLEKQRDQARKGRQEKKASYNSATKRVNRSYLRPYK